MRIKRQNFIYFLMAVGAALVLYAIFSENDNLYIKIIGLLLLMFGVYSVSQSRSIGKMENDRKESAENDEISDEENGENS